MIREPAHYLKPLVSTRVPKRLAFIATHAYSSREDGAFVERWNTGAVGFTHWTSRASERRDHLDGCTSPYHMWQTVDAFCTGNRRVVLFTYDLARELRIGQALRHLPALGWELERIVLERGASWALFREGKRSLMCCDLKSWCPVTYGTIFADVCGQVTGLQELIAGPEMGAAYAANRVLVIREATLRILDWIVSQELGPFRPTGSGQSYAAYRRRFLSHKLLVHDDELLLQAERRAMWAGRCEAWRHGKQANGPFVEYDMHAAYCHIAAECDVPVRAMGQIHHPTTARLSRIAQTESVLADVTITTQVPCVPTSMAGRTIWPIGTFRTTLWDPELQLASEYADQLTCHRAWRYAREPALKQFANTVLDGMLDISGTHHPLTRRVLKHWSRCLVGRFGLRFRSWQKFGYSDDIELELVTFVDVDAGVTTDMLMAGRTMLVLADMQESSESLPQIPSWVMSECRRRLWRMMEHAGLNTVAYVDTDSIIVQADAVPYLETISGDDGCGTWLRKAQYSALVINGPRNLDCDGSRRVSGLPLTATQTGPLEFEGTVMRSVKESMRNGQLDCVASVPRRFILDAPDLRRQHLPNGSTIPFTVTQPTLSEDNL